MNPVSPSTTTSGTEPRPNAITGAPQAIASTMLRPNGSSKLIRWRSAAAPPRTSARLSGPTDPEIANPIAVDVWGDLAFEIGPVLDNPGDDEPPTAATGDLDRFRCAFFGMNAAKEQQAAI